MKLYILSLLISDLMACRATQRYIPCLITKLVISYIYSNYNRVNQRSSGDEDIGLCGSRGDAPSIQGALPQVCHEDAPPLEHCGSFLLLGSQWSLRGGRQCGHPSLVLCSTALHVKSSLQIPNVRMPKYSPTSASLAVGRRAKVTLGGRGCDKLGKVGTGAGRVRRTALSSSSSSPMPS